MLYLASLPNGMTTAFREIARKMDVPDEFLAKILKALARADLVRPTRGSKGGYSIARDPASVSILDVIEALEGRIQVNICTDETASSCLHGHTCTMARVWQEGQRRMVEVYRDAKLDKLAMRSLGHRSPVAHLPPGGSQHHSKESPWPRSSRTLPKSARLQPA